MKIALSAESTIDMPKEMLEKYNIKTLPFSILLGGTELKKDGEINTQEVFAYVAKTKVLPKTSAINQMEYQEYFENLLKEYDAVIHISLSSGISSAFSNAQTAAAKLKNVYVVDSQSLSTGIALLALYARKMIDGNLDIEDIVLNLEIRKNYLQVSFLVDKLDYLYKGGRCSSLQLFGANLLNLKPQIVVNNGKMKSAKKYRGNFDKVIFDYVNDTLKEFNKPDLENIFITYTTAKDDTVAKIKEILLNKGFKNIFITTANCTIASHCGENTLGILYFNDGDDY